MGIGVSVEDISVIEFAKPRRLGGVISEVIDVVLRGSLADGLTTLGIEGSVVVHQPHAHVRVVVIAVDGGIDGLVRERVERRSQHVSVRCASPVVRGRLRSMMNEETYVITT